VLERSLDVSVSPECLRDVPYINFRIVPVGFTPDPPRATLVIRAANDTLVDTIVVDSLSGRLLWPGAAVDANGNATDWPGWKLAEDGATWVTDDSDAFVRDGLSIEFTVNPTATATVAYPEATAACASPPETVPPTTVPLVASPTTSTADASVVTGSTVPPTTTAELTSELPRTGSSGIVTMLAMGLGLIVLGAAARRVRKV
jgi:LPXTG-motif cell wall-anchored protein